MSERVAVVGVGCTACRALSPEVSFRELIFEAATRAYQDAGIEPREVDTFVSVSEDYREGTAIFDEYVPDQLGAVLKPVHTICGDGLTGVAAAFMQLRTGRFHIAVVEGHSKASNILYPAHLDAFALDPVFVRPLGFHPSFVAGLEMRAYLAGRGYREEHAAMVVAKNRGNAIRNPLAAFPARLELADVLASSPLAEPVKELDQAPPADGAVVVVLARESVARHLQGEPVFIRGIGWAQDTPDLDQREWEEAVYARLAARMAYDMAGVKNPRREFDLAEVDDTFSYKELQHLEALGLALPGEAGRMLEAGCFGFRGELPVNVSGGHLGNGHLHEAAALRSLAEAVWQLRGRAGGRQVPGVETCVVQSWRGLPAASGAVAVLSCA